MARDVTVRLRAEVQGYLDAIRQAEEATTRLADVVDRLGDISISADSSVASDLDQAASSADSAASSMEGASGAAEGMAGGLDSASAAAQDAAGGMESAGASAETAAGGLSTVGAQSQTVTADMLSVSAAAQDAGGGLESAGASAETASAGLSSVGAQSQDVAAAMSQASGSARNAEAALVGVGAQSQTAASGMSAASAAAADVSGQMSSLNRGFLETAGNMEGDFNRVAGSLAVVGGGITAVNGYLAATGIQYNTLQQVSARAMETMTGSASAAADQMERLHAFADESPFSRATWIEAQQQLMAFGMEGERVIPVMEGIQNSVAAIGGGDQEIMRLVDILGTVEGQGRMTGTELQRLGQMGINAAELMGEAMGMTGNEIREQITAGAMDAGTAIDALADGMNTRFDGAAEGLRDTFTGALDRIQARIRDIASIMMTPLVNPDGGGFLIDIMNQAADLGSQLLELHPAVLQVMGGFSGLAGAGLLAAGGFIALAPQVAASVDAFRRMQAAHPGITRGLGRLAGAAGILSTAFIALQVASELAGSGIDDLQNADEIANRLRSMQGDAEGLAGAVTELTSAQGSWLNQTASVEGLSSAFESLSMNGLERATDSAKSLFGVFDSDYGLAVEAVSQVDTALTQLAEERDFSGISAGMQVFAAEAEAAGVNAQAMAAEHLPDLMGALDGIASSFGYSATNAELYQWALTGVAPAAVEAAMEAEGLESGIDGAGDAAAESEPQMSGFAEAAGTIADVASEASSGLSGMVEALRTLGIIERDATQAAGEYHAQLREMNELMLDTASTLDVTTEAGQRNYDALAGLADAGWNMAEANMLAGASVEEVAGQLQSQYGTVLGYVEALGYTGDEAHRLATELMGIDPEIDLRVEADALDAARLMAEGLGDELDGMEGIRTVEIEAVTEAAFAALDELENTDRSILMEMHADPAVAEQVVWDFVSGEYIAVADVDGNVDPAAAVMAAFLNRDYQTVADILAEDPRARQVMNQFLNSDWQTTADILGNSAPAEGTMNSLINTNWVTDVEAIANTGTAESNINHAARNRTATITVTEIVRRQRAGNGARGNMPGYATGGIARLPRPNIGAGLAGLPGYSSGGILPYTGLGTDKIIGLDSNGWPVARLDDGEMIIQRAMTEKYEPLLWAVNNDDPYGIKRYASQLAGYANGGRAGYQGQVREFSQSSAPRVTVQAPQAGGPSREAHFHITNNYPQAEPTSMTIKRSLEYAPLVGFDD